MGLFDKLKQLSDVADQIKDSVAATGILSSQDMVRKSENTPISKDSIKGLEASLRVSDELNQELTRQLEQARAKIQKLESQNTGIAAPDSDKIKSLQSTINELSNVVLKLETEISTLKTEKNDALKNLEKCQEELAEANSIPKAEGFSWKDYVSREDYKSSLQVNQKLQAALQKQVEALEHGIKIRNWKLRELKDKYFIDDEDLEDINF
ncbi:MAG: hypothetical protein NC453_11450 [Muribaculum sp.]|nr:hypothetical protein [Muribaculum sp.]